MATDPAPTRRRDDGEDLDFLGRLGKTVGLTTSIAAAVVVVALVVILLV